jgi:hypothetical protein
MTTTRASVGTTGLPAAAAARSAGESVVALELSIRLADNTRRRRPLIVTSNLSGPSPEIGTPFRSMTCTSRGMTSRLDRNVVCGFWVVSGCWLCWPAAQRVAVPSAHTAARVVSRFLMGCCITA